MDRLSNGQNSSVLKLSLGYESKHESKGIKKFVNTISDQLFSLNPNVSEGLVGMGIRSQYLKSQLQIGSGGVRMLVSLKVTALHAFHENKLVEDYEELSQSVVSYCGGLPLSVQVLGSSLFDKDKNEWMSALARLEDNPEMEIVEKLQISYDGLKHVEKEVKALEQKSLITTSYPSLIIHHLILEMAQYIVCWESPYNPEKHSRVWKTKEIDNMCYELATTENNHIEVIKCDGKSPLFCKVVSNMKKLRLLKVTRYNGEDVEGPKFLSNELRYIHCRYYPASPLPENSRLRKLVVLKLDHSLQEALWEGYKSQKEHSRCDLIPQLS
ncbi:Toll/interleukin-1 receptor domain-containing protein [Tanacetum coccineum]